MRVKVVTRIVLALLDRGADIEARDFLQRTPLHIASEYDRLEVGLALLDRGADVDARDVNQMTPLHAVCYNGNMELAMALVDRGADVDARTVNQRTPLNYACNKGKMELAMALVDRGAHVDEKILKKLGIKRSDSVSSMSSISSKSCGGRKGSNRKKYKGGKTMILKTRKRKTK